MAIYPLVRKLRRFVRILRSARSLGSSLREMVKQRLARDIAMAEFSREFERFRAVHDGRFQTFRAHPMLSDKAACLGFDRHYVYHTAWAARVLAQTCPSKHVDVSSVIWFPTTVSAWIPVDYYEWQLPRMHLENVRIASADLTCLPLVSGSVQSISCMHVIEHVGLGRYGDPLDPGGDLRAAEELSRVVSLGGQLLCVVPVAEYARVEFNAHRVYTYSQVIGMFPAFELVEFAIVPDADQSGGLIRCASVDSIRGQEYACGCFHLRKL